MNQRIDKIRQLLNELESEPGTQFAGDREFPASDLPLVIQQIVDDLQPQLSPYDAAFYWFLFRHSIAKDGDPHLRVSTRQLQTAVVKSSYSQLDDNPVSLGKVQDTLRLSNRLAQSARRANPIAMAHFIV